MNLCHSEPDENLSQWNVNVGNDVMKTNQLENSLSYALGPSIQYSNLTWTSSLFISGTTKLNDETALLSSLNVSGTTALSI